MLSKKQDVIYGDKDFTDKGEGIGISFSIKLAASTVNGDADD